jgi:6-phosphogluconolactonase
MTAPEHRSRRPTPRASIVWAWRGDDAAVVDFLAARIRPDCAFRAAIAGGTTPRPILYRLAARPLAWNRVTVFPTDERLVHECFDASNYGMLSRALDHTGASVERLGPATPAADLVWLGMAADGKIASLFDADDARRPGEIVRTEPPAGALHAPHHRLSMSIAALACAPEIILVVRGAEKRRLVEAAADGDMTLPLAHLLHRTARPLTVFWSPA